MSSDTIYLPHSPRLGIRISLKIGASKAILASSNRTKKKSTGSRAQPYRESGLDPESRRRFCGAAQTFPPYKIKSLPCELSM